MDFESRTLTGRDRLLRKIPMGSPGFSVCEIASPAHRCNFTSSFSHLETFDLSGPPALAGTPGTGSDWSGGRGPPRLGLVRQELSSSPWTAGASHTTRHGFVSEPTVWARPAGSGAGSRASSGCRQVSSTPPGTLGVQRWWRDPARQGRGCIARGQRCFCRWGRGRRWAVALWKWPEGHRAC